MLKTIVNYILNRNLMKKKDRDELARQLESGVTGEVLALLLRAMSMIFTLNKNFKKNIINFNARYVFNSKDKSFAVSIIFGNNKMSVHKKIIGNPNVTITFKSAKALKDLALSPKPDIFQALIKQDVSINGNFNYLLRFASMLNELQLMGKK
ncbi:MAG: SCP2 sterol-binding domain-containing protein [bacterium]|nr:SCP2 sterol-binding domain-containing protein [bacterium]